MKRSLSAALLSAALLLTLSACGGSTAPAPSAPAPTAAPAAETPDSAATSAPAESSPADPAESSAGSTAADPAGAHALVIYFSHTGTTAGVAQEIAAQTGAALFELVPTEPYTQDYNTLLEVAQAEKDASARPEFSGSIEGFADADTVYVGFPNWWGDMPMILYTLFDTYDFSGKTIVPFVTSGGSGFSNTLATMAALEPEATLLEGLSLGSSAAAQPAGAVADWLSSLDLTA